MTEALATSSEEVLRDVASVEVEYVDPVRGRQRGPLTGCWSARFEAMSPVRGFASYRGQRNWPGSWWFSRTGTHVGYESWVERDTLMALDADPAVEAVASQPMWLSWTDESGQAKRHAPDFFVRRTDSTAVLVDVRPDDRVDTAAMATFADTAAMASQVGWEYRRVGALDTVTAANLRWLAGYRHPRCARPATVAALREVFDRPRPLREGAAAVGDPPAVLPALFAMLWRRELAADLDAQVLGSTSMVWSPATGAS